MLRIPAHALIAFVAMICAASAAQMAPTAPEKMSSPADKQKMKACEARAAAQNVPMDQRAKFVMSCMTHK
jgi:hypothetical protein